MCDIAGYTGFRRAAPVLIDMMRREEGFWGGYYTGIATVDNGKVYCAKVVGDLSTLLAQTDAYDLPGTVGIIQSRTPSGGDQRWAYPFVSCDEKLAFVENGSFGAFEGRTDFAGAAMRLLAQGHTLSSRTEGRVSHYDLLPDGTSVHYCDVYCHLAEQYMREGMDALGALMRATREYPSECVTVSVHASCPRSLLVTRFNQPMYLKRAAGEAFAATTALAFPSTADYGVDRLPANMGCEITPDGVRMASVLNPEVRVADVDAKRIAAGTERALEILSRADAPVTFPQIAEEMKRFFPDGALSQFAPLGYAAVEALVQSGRAKLCTLWKEGMEPGLHAPVFGIYRV